MGGCNADDGERRLLDQEFLSQYPRISGEHARPERVTDDGDRMSTDPVVFVRCERPANRGVDAQQGKEIGGDQLSLGGFARGAGTWVCQMCVKQIKIIKG